MKSVLYLTYDGLTDPLGQSQILPYLEGLSDLGYRFIIISFEKESNFSERKELIRLRCSKRSIEWIPLRYTKNPPILSTIYDLQKLRKKCREIFSIHSVDLVHVRSYIPALIALEIKKKQNIPFLFDKRGFWIEERIEGNIWNPHNPLFKIVIKYFKKKEKELFLSANGIISLTLAAKNALLNGQVFDLNHRQGIELEKKIFIIPCAADERIFYYIDSDERERAKSIENIPLDHPVFIYLGSIGTWYMFDEILLTYKFLLERLPNLWFSIITSTPKKIILQKLNQFNIPTEKVRVEFVQRENLRQKLSIADFSVNFMRPGYSRLATSPVKIGELLSLGIPLIINSDIGDSQNHIKTVGEGIIVSNHPNNIDFELIKRHIDQLINADRESIAKRACEIFSLRKAVQNYKNAYEFILQ